MRTAYSRLHSTGLYAVQQARGPKAQMASKSQNSPPKAQGLPKRKVQSAHIRQGARVKQSSKPMPTEVVSLGWGKVYPNGTFFRSRERSKTHTFNKNFQTSENYPNKVSRRTRRDSSATSAVPAAEGSYATSSARDQGSSFVPQFFGTRSAQALVPRNNCPGRC